ncbi:hypothetical protein C6496_12170 [Candidatus Poribacteria bacterium]|nr:MAG: hypothetical protein C6496_12170 [Candidatus Poribacteria bacterium]
MLRIQGRYQIHSGEPFIFFKSIVKTMEYEYGFKILVGYGVDSVKTAKYIGFLNLLKKLTWKLKDCLPVQNIIFLAITVLIHGIVVEGIILRWRRIFIPIARCQKMSPRLD